MLVMPYLNSSITCSEENSCKKVRLFGVTYQEPVSVNIENPATVSKFSISSYFAQINPLVSYFRKHN